MTKEYGELSLKEMKKNPECGWLQEDAAIPENDALQSLKNQDWKNYQFRVYLGCWCSDSKNLIPEFISVKDAAGIPDKNIRYFNLDLDKTSPDKVEQKDSIEYVPTIIVLKDGKETGRIVETVPADLASALVAIL